MSETEKIPKNPYSQPFHEWPPEVLAAYESFPKGANGFNLGLNKHTEEQWRKWCAEHPRELWPIWVHQYAAEKKRQAEACRARSLGLRS